MRPSVHRNVIEKEKAEEKNWQHCRTVEKRGEEERTYGEGGVSTKTDVLHLRGRARDGAMRLQKFGNNVLELMFGNTSDVMGSLILHHDCSIQ